MTSTTTNSDANELLYAKGSHIWIANAETVWEAVCIEKDYKNGDLKIHTTRKNGQSLVITLQNDTLPPLCNPSVLIGQNDLVALSYLHEPAVLHNLEVRFCERQAIYTYCGIILVAINPYADLPLYGSDIIRAYRGHAMGDLEPHIFAVAEEAYAKLEREKCDLSIIVSGESGAGKTVSAKYTMRYFAAVGGSQSETQVERKVLASSPIMEAFGNAKTTRNDNSSRFGKFTKLLFKNEMGAMSLTGATMQTYLLEKSRVVFQAIDERNYHIFYQLCSARENFPGLLLDHQNKFKYLNMGGNPDIANISDSKNFEETQDALRTLEFNKNEISDILRILAGILHLGNITFQENRLNSKDSSQEGCDISATNLNLQVVGDILKIQSKELRQWLIFRQIKSVNEYVLIPNNISYANASKDALAKHIYAKLFHYIVDIINKSLNSDRDQNCFIGVLDIYGFETFEINSFEQFCINYANEKLQQQFNQHVFKLEQEEYLKEGIIWNMIDFYDNQPCIDLIESKLGVLELLDEECKMPRGSDESWNQKLIEKCIKYSHFGKPRFGSSSFFIKHFSDTVQYEANGFLEKNRDTVSKELVNVLRQSELQLCKKLMDIDDSHLNVNKNVPIEKKSFVKSLKPVIDASKQHKQSVGSQFRESLKYLIETLHSTTPHYVRCIKPNENKSPFTWKAPKIVQQLRACGVLETVRISAAGFPSRWTYYDFYMRYQLLCKLSEIQKSDVVKTSRIIILKCIKDTDKYRFGKTQIFFRAGLVAYLEQIRSNIRKKSILTVQAVIKGFVYRKRYIRLQKSALGIQRHARGLLARRKAKELRENRAAVIIQKNLREWICRCKFIKLKYAIMGIQKFAKGLLARRNFKILTDNANAIKVQRYCRGYLARVAFKNHLNQIIKCQCAVRSYLARKKYKNLKAEARTISHIQKLNKGYENKIISLQQRIDELNRNISVLKTQNSEIPELKQQIEIKKKLEHDLNAFKMTMKEKESEVEILSKQLVLQFDEKMSLLNEKEIESSKWNKLQETLKIENDNLKQQMNEIIEISKKETKTNRSRILSELDYNEIHEAYQKAVNDKENLEKKNNLLIQEIERMQNEKNDGETEPMSMKTGEDFGYSSATSTLELKTYKNSAISEDLPKTDQTSLILRLRKILEDEKNKNDHLANRVELIMKRYKSSLAAEDSLRFSELEVENEKLYQQYERLRNSIERGVEVKELEAQYKEQQEELRRRRDECIQLKAVLAEQSQSLNNSKNFKYDNKSDLVELFQSQKLINRQLESELTALNEDYNARLQELSKDNDDLKNENKKLLDIVQNQIDEDIDMTVDVLRRNKLYLKLELTNVTTNNLLLQERINGLQNKLDEAIKSNNYLKSQLCEHGIVNKETMQDTNKKNLEIKKKTPRYQGIFKHRHEDLDKILNRLITDFAPRTAITLLPGLPAYIIFMCIRYTDLLNADQHVKDLLTKFVILMKKGYRQPSTTECRVLWLVNTIIIHNLLKQYGGIEEYLQMNTDVQNEHQLKNFDLSEYRKVIYELITNIYSKLVQQIQELLKPYIVPAILDHDEISRPNRTVSLDITPDQNKRTLEPKSLVNQLDHYYKQFQFFGLDSSYAEQIFKQFFYYICAISMNSLMLRSELCMWKTGMLIRYNISCLENWARKKKIPNDILSPLNALNQVSALLQSRKNEEDVQSIYDLCSSLSKGQILRILKQYNHDDYEENRISNTFIEKLKEKLDERDKNISECDKFTMDENCIYPLIVIFKYNEIKLEEIDLAKSLNIDELLSKI